jgi:aspartate kinase
MALIVQKYGGTSVGDLERIEAVADRRRSGQGDPRGRQRRGGGALRHGRGDRPPAGDGPPGERQSVPARARRPALDRRAGQHRAALHVPRTDTSHTRARIQDIDVDAINRALAEAHIAVVAGFQGVDQDGNITTLGRGGSDTTAVALAAALEAGECQIYTDVDGVYTSDPRVVPGARRMDTVTFEEMLELASLGARVLQIRAVEFASKYNVTLRVLSSFEEGQGTLITSEDSTMEQPLIAGVAFNRDEAKLTVKGVPDRPGIAALLLGPIAEAEIDVDMIVQNVSEDSTTDMTFTVQRHDYDAALALLEQHSRDMGASEVTGGQPYV